MGANQVNNFLTGWHIKNFHQEYWKLRRAVSSWYPESQDSNALLLYCGFSHLDRNELPNILVTTGWWCFILIAFSNIKTLFDDACEPKENLCQNAGNTGFNLQTSCQALNIKLCPWESKTEITGSSSWRWDRESHRPLAVVASGPAPPVVLLLALLVVPGVEVVPGVVCEMVNSTELVGCCCDDNQSAAGVDWGGGGASVDTVGGSPDVLSVGAWPGVTAAPAAGCTVTANTSAVPFVEVCPCVRVTDSLGTGGEVEECHYLFKAFTVFSQFTAGKLAFVTVCLNDLLGVGQRQKYYLYSVKVILW